MVPNEDGTRGGKNPGDGLPVSQWPRISAYVLAFANRVIADNFRFSGNCVPLSSRMVGPFCFAAEMRLDK